jgi:hypothetical protein
VSLVYSPPPAHHCNIGWRVEGQVLVHDREMTWANPGTVVACGCGRTWVAFKRLAGGNFIDLTTHWRPERRLERWRRLRRERRGAF